MSRQSKASVGPLPMPPLNIEELRFWLEILSDHALFIQAGLPADNLQLRKSAQEFYQTLSAELARIDRVQSEKGFNELVADVRTTVREFYHFKHQLLHLMLTCRLVGCSFPLQLDHMAREALYVLRLLDKIGGANPVFQYSSRTHETAFWLRLMDDHTHFIRQGLDPSERMLIGTIEDFCEEFDDLFRQSWDFVSMLHHRRADVPAYGRFLQDVRSATVRLRNFKRALFDMIEECRLVSIIPVLVADHIRREADHFLMVAAMIEKGMLEGEQDEADCPACQMDELIPETESAVLDKEWGSGQEEDGECDYHLPNPSSKSGSYVELDEDDDDLPIRPEAEEPATGKSPAETEMVIIPEVISPSEAEVVNEMTNEAVDGMFNEIPAIPPEVPVKVSGKASGKTSGKIKEGEAPSRKDKSAKVHWGGNWPRPLGKK